jgi:hypothetical protein
LLLPLLLILLLSKQADELCINSSAINRQLQRAPQNRQPRYRLGHSRLQLDCSGSCGNLPLHDMLAVNAFDRRTRCKYRDMGARASAARVALHLQ